MGSMYDRVLFGQVREQEKKLKAQYQAWDLTAAISLAYVGAQATARASILAGPKGITVQYVGAEASGTVEVQENQLILCAPALTPVATLDLTAAANDTLTELKNVIDALADWTCSVDAESVGTELSKNLAVVAAQACKGAAYTCLMDRCLFVEAPNATPDTNVGPGGKVFLRATAYDTLSELVAFLNGLADYVCTLGSQFDGTEASTVLANVGATSIKTALNLAATANPQMVITIPAPTGNEQITFTGFVGKSTYGGGTSTILVYDGSTLVWSEPGGATTVIKESLLKGYTMTAGNSMKVKVLNSTEMTAGEMSVAYEIKDSAPLLT